MDERATHIGSLIEKLIVLFPWFAHGGEAVARTFGVEIATGYVREEANLTLGIMCTIGPRRLTGLLAEFGRRYPGVTIRLAEGVARNLLERIESGELDLVIIANPDGFSERLEAHRLYLERFVIAFPEGHRYSAMTSIPMREIHGESYLRRINCEYPTSSQSGPDLSSFVLALAVRVPKSIVLTVAESRNGTYADDCKSESLDSSPCEYRKGFRSLCRSPYSF